MYVRKRYVCVVLEQEKAKIKRLKISELFLLKGCNFVIGESFSLLAFNANCISLDTLCSLFIYILT